MKNWLKKLQEKNKMVGICNLLALAVMVYTANAACLWVIHQPKVPDEIRALRKF